MNTVLDVLFLRKPRIEYVSPPVCEAIFSGSGQVVISLSALDKLHAPTGLKLGGSGRHFLSWSGYPGQLCYSIYFELDPGNPASPYNLLDECIPANTISVCSSGYYEISAITPSGESPLSSPIYCDGFTRILIPLPQYPGTTGYNLYKNSDTSNIAGTYSLYIDNFAGNLYEVCQSGCYRVSSITPEGETPLSDPVCSDCSEQPCPEGFTWHPEFCGCTCPVQTCDAGFKWDPFLCECVEDGGSGGFSLVRTACLGDLYTESLMAPESFVGPCNFQVVAGVLPSGLALTIESGILASLTGTPDTAAVTGFTIKVTDANGRMAGYVYEFRVYGFTNSTPPVAAVGTPYNFQLTADGGTPPYTFTIDSGALPSGLGLTTDGLISGTPV